MNPKIIYLAGIVDGEGSMSIEIQSPRKNRKTDYYSIRLIVINTNKNLMDWLINNFQGKIQPRKLYPGRKQCYNWVTFSHHSASLLEQMLPYLIIKKRHAEIILEFMKTKNPEDYFVSEEVQHKRRLLYHELKSLTKTGV